MMRNYCYVLSATLLASGFLTLVMGLASQTSSGHLTFALAILLFGTSNMLYALGRLFVELREIKQERQHTPERQRPSA